MPDNGRNNNNNRGRGTASERALLMEIQTEHPHIVKKGGILSGEAIIKGTRTPVRAIVELWRMGYMPEEIPQGLPHLTLAAIFDAQSREIHALTARDAGRLEESDAGQLAFATANGMAILTHNRGDFEALHREYLDAGRRV
jgi:uncharacterized protein (DUF433 family)